MTETFGWLATIAASAILLGGLLASALDLAEAAARYARLLPPRAGGYQTRPMAAIVATIGALPLLDWLVPAFIAQQDPTLAALTARPVLLALLAAWLAHGATRLLHRAPRPRRP